MVTRDVSEIGAFVECETPVSIPLYRLVQLQLATENRKLEPLPTAFRQARIQAAVYRVRASTSSGVKQGIALRLMVDPKWLAGLSGDERASA